MAAFERFRVASCLRKYEAMDFEVTREIGSVSFRQERSSRAVRAARCYAATYAPRIPYRSEVLVLLKEVLPTAKDLASKEISAYEELTRSSGEAFRFEETETMTTIRKEPPVAPLLGYFDAQGMDMEDGLPSTWLVLRWQGVQNMLDFIRAYREKENSQQPRFRWFLGEEKMEDTQVARYLKQTFRGSLSAVKYCHDQGVAHCALDGSSFLLSSLDVRSANTLRTTISNFGFSRIRAGCSEEEWREVMRLDMEALGLTMAELVLSTLSLEERDVQATRSELERIYVDVFQRDFKSMKEYCQLEDKWEKAIQLLDAREEAGWKVLGALFSGLEPPTVLLESTFLQG